MISVVIPARNEPYLNFLIREIEKYILEPHEILVEREKGFANAVLHGIERSKGDIIVIMDGDGSHNPRYLPWMIRELDRNDVIIGSRYVGGGSQDGILRRAISRVFCIVTRILLDLEINDNMSGFIVAKKRVFEELRLCPLGYKFGLEIMVKGKKRFKISEYPIMFERKKIGAPVHVRNIGYGISTICFILRLFAVDKKRSDLTPPQVCPKTLKCSPTDLNNKTRRLGMREERLSSNV